jgi:hypothetical protein
LFRQAGNIAVIADALTGHGKRIWLSLRAEGEAIPVLKNQ